MNIGSVFGNSSACAISAKKVLVIYKFAEGSVVFSCAKAAKGTLEKLVIKEVRLLNNNKTYLHWVPLYIDTLNGIWNENELCSELDARNLAVNYLQQQQQNILDALAQCQIPTKFPHHHHKKDCRCQ